MKPITWLTFKRKIFFLIQTPMTLTFVMVTITRIDSFFFFFLFFLCWVYYDAEFEISPLNSTWVRTNISDSCPKQNVCHWLQTSPKHAPKLLQEYAHNHSIHICNNHTKTELSCHLIISCCFFSTEPNQKEKKNGKLIKSYPHAKFKWWHLNSLSERTNAKDFTESCSSVKHNCCPRCGNNTSNRLEKEPGQ